MLKRATGVAALRPVIIAATDAAHAHFIGVSEMAEARKSSHDLRGMGKEGGYKSSRRAAISFILNLAMAVDPPAVTDNSITSLSDFINCAFGTMTS